METLLIPGAGLVEIAAGETLNIPGAGLVEIEAAAEAETPQPVQTYRYLHMLIR